MSAAMHGLLLLLRLRLRLLGRGSVSKSGAATAGRRRLFTRIAIIGVLAVALSLSLARLLSNVVSGPLGRAVLPPLLTLVSSWAVLLVFLFAVPAVLAALTYSSDLKLLLLTPLSPRVILGEKFLLAYSGLALPVVVIGAVILIGIAQALSLGLAYDVVVVLMLLLLPVAPLALAMLLTVAVLRWVPPARARNVTAILGALLGIAIYIGSQLLTMRGGQAIVNLRGSLTQASQAWWSSLPTTWPGQVLAAVSQQQTGTALSYAAALVALAAILAALAIGWSAHLFATGWATYQEVGRRSRPAAGTVAAAAALPPNLPAQRAAHAVAETRSGQGGPTWWPLVGKEWRTLVRDPRLWARLLYPLAVVVFGFYRTFTRNVVPSTATAGGAISLFNVGWFYGTLAFMTYIVVASLALPLINREGRALYLLALSPLSARDVLLAKWSFAVLPVFILVEGALVIGAFILGIPVWVALLGALALASLIVALAGAVLLVSLIWPRLDWDNPRQQVSGTASLVGMLGGIILVAGVCLLLILTLAWSSSQPLAAIATGLGLFVVTGLVIVAVAVVAPRRLQRLLGGA